MIYGGTKRLLVGFLVLGLAATLSTGCGKSKTKGGGLSSVAVNAVGNDEPAKPGGDPAKRIKPETVLEVPFIFWGGDVATFHAHGRPETTPPRHIGQKGVTP